MEQAEHNITVGDSGQRYRAPETKVIFVNTQGMLCQSPGNEPMQEHDFGGGGFGNDY